MSTEGKESSSAVKFYKTLWNEESFQINLGTLCDGAKETRDIWKLASQQAIAKCTEDCIKSGFRVLFKFTFLGKNKYLKLNRRKCKF